MKKVGDVLAIVSSLLLILAYLVPNFYDKVEYIYVVSILMNLKFELMILLLIGVALIFIRKKNISLRKYKALYTISPSQHKSWINLVLLAALFLSLSNIYFLARAKRFYYRNVLFSSLELKKEIVGEAMRFENEGSFDLAIKKYQQYISLCDESADNYFLKEKIKTLESRIAYGNDFYRQARNEYNEKKRYISLKGMSLTLLSYNVFPQSHTIKTFAKNNADRIVKRIDSFMAHIRSQKNHSEVNSELYSIIGPELKRHFETGAHGKPINPQPSLSEFLGKIDPMILEKYLKNSWRYDDCVMLSQEQKTP